MMMMKKNSNSKPSASKLGNNGGRERKQPLQKSSNSPRSPLKMRDFNVSYSSCSSSSTVSTATTVSSEAPRGCLRFFLSHHHSSSNASKNVSNKKKSAVAKTPKSAPNVKNLRSKMGGGNVVTRKWNNLPNPEKHTSRRGDKLRKNTPLSSRSGFSDKFSSGFELNLCDNAAKFTPVAKMGCGSGLDGFVRNDKALNLGDNDTNCSDTNSPTPPVQVSLSPEIQGGSTSVVPATPNTCYAAGHVLSGVSDRRKCKPRGILTIGDSDLFGSSKPKMFDNGDENVSRDVSNRRVSLAPSPTEASMQWLLSPCDEKRGEGHEDDDTNELRLNHGEGSVPLKSIGCSSSPSSSLGFSSEMFNKSNSTITTSDATTATHSSRRSRSYFLNRDSTSEFQGLVGPSLDYLVCTPSSSSPVSTPSYEVDVSSEHGKYRYDHAGEATSYLEDSTGSGNVIQTPQSNSSNTSSPYFGLSNLSRDEISRLWFECELDSVTEVSRRTSLSPECRIPMVDSPRVSFEFNPLIEPTDSIDFTLFQKAIDSQAPLGIPESLLHCLPESDVRISWREGLASRIFEMDELDCCRCFSDEEEDANGNNDPFESPFPELGAADSNKVAASTSDPAILVQHEDSAKRKGEETEGPNPCGRCGETISNDEGSLPAPEDSGWKACYKNHLFQV